MTILELDKTELADYRDIYSALFLGVELKKERIESFNKTKKHIRKMQQGKIKYSHETRMFKSCIADNKE